MTTKKKKSKKKSESQRVLSIDLTLKMKKGSLLEEEKEILLRRREEEKRRMMKREEEGIEEIERRRQRFYSDERLREVLATFWMVISGHCKDCKMLSKEEYIEFKMMMLYALMGYESVDEDEAKQHAELAYQNDIAFYDTIDEVAFKDILAESIEIYAGLISKRYHAAFAWSLLKCIVNLDASPPRFHKPKTMKGLSEMANIESTIVAKYFADKRERDQLSYHKNWLENNEITSETRTRLKDRRGGRYYADKDAKELFDTLEAYRHLVSMSFIAQYDRTNRDWLLANSGKFGFDDSMSTYFDADVAENGVDLNMDIIAHGNQRGSSLSQGSFKSERLSSSSNAATTTAGNDTCREFSKESGSFVFDECLKVPNFESKSDSEEGSHVPDSSSSKGTDNNYHVKFDSLTFVDVSTNGDEGEMKASLTDGMSSQFQNKLNAMKGGDNDDAGMYGFLPGQAMGHRSVSTPTHATLSPFAENRKKPSGVRVQQRRGSGRSVASNSSHGRRSQHNTQQPIHQKKTRNLARTHSGKHLFKGQSAFYSTETNGPDNPSPSKVICVPQSPGNPQQGHNCEKTEGVASSSLLTPKQVLDKRGLAKLRSKKEDTHPQVSGEVSRGAGFSPIKRGSSRRVVRLPPSRSFSDLKNAYPHANPSLLLSFLDQAEEFASQGASAEELDLSDTLFTRALAVSPPPNCKPSPAVTCTIKRSDQGSNDCQSYTLEDYVNERQGYMSREHLKVSNIGDAMVGIARKYIFVPSGFSSSLGRRMKMGNVAINEDDIFIMQFVMAMDDFIKMKMAHNRTTDYETFRTQLLSSNLGFKHEFLVLIAKEFSISDRDSSSNTLSSVDLFDIIHEKRVAMLLKLHEDLSHAWRGYARRKDLPLSDDKLLPEYIYIPCHYANSLGERLKVGDGRVTGEDRYLMAVVEKIDHEVNATASMELEPSRSVFFESVSDSSWGHSKSRLAALCREFRVDTSRLCNVQELLERVYHARSGALEDVKRLEKASPLLLPHRDEASLKRIVDEKLREGSDAYCYIVHLFDALIESERCYESTSCFGEVCDNLLNKFSGEGLCSLVKAHYVDDTDIDAGCDVKSLLKCLFLKRLALFNAKEDEAYFSRRGYSIRKQETSLRYVYRLKEKHTDLSSEDEQYVCQLLQDIDNYIECKSKYLEERSVFEFFMQHKSLKKGYSKHRLLVAARELHIDTNKKTDTIMDEIFEKRRLEINLATKHWLDGRLGYQKASNMAKMTVLQVIDDYARKRFFGEPAGSLEKLCSYIFAAKNISWFDLAGLCRDLHIDIKSSDEDLDLIKALYIHRKPLVYATQMEMFWSKRGYKRTKFLAVRNATDWPEFMFVPIKQEDSLAHRLLCGPCRLSHDEAYVVKTITSIDHFLDQENALVNVQELCQFLSSLVTLQAGYTVCGLKQAAEECHVAIDENSFNPLLIVKDIFLRRLHVINSLEEETRHRKRGLIKRDDLWILESSQLPEFVYVSSVAEESLQLRLQHGATALSEIEAFLVRLIDEVDSNIISQKGENQPDKWIEKVLHSKNNFSPIIQTYVCKQLGLRDNLPPRELLMAVYESRLQAARCMWREASLALKGYVPSQLLPVVNDEVLSALSEVVYLPKRSPSSLGQRMKHAMAELNQDDCYLMKLIEAIDQHIHTLHMTSVSPRDTETDDLVIKANEATSIDRFCELHVSDSSGCSKHRLHLAAAECFIPTQHLSRQMSLKQILEAIYLSRCEQLKAITSTDESTYYKFGWLDKTCLEGINRYAEKFNRMALSLLNPRRLVLPLPAKDPLGALELLCLTETSTQCPSRDLPLSPIRLIRMSSSKHTGAVLYEDESRGDAKAAEPEMYVFDKLSRCTVSYKANLDHQLQSARLSTTVPTEARPPWVPRGGLEVMVSDKLDPVLHWQEERQLMGVAEPTRDRCVLKRQEVVKEAFERHARWLSGRWADS